MPLDVDLCKFPSNYLGGVIVYFFQKNENILNPVSKRNKSSNQKFGI